MIEAVEYTPNLEGTWREFLAQSNNGTLFHSLDFLAYHAPGRFDTRHLMLYSEGQLAAVLPAAVAVDDNSRKILKSPYGASVGGPVLAAGQSATETAALLGCIKQYAVDAGMAGVDMRISPAVYSSQPDDHLSYAFFAGGFQLITRHLCHVIPLPRDPDQVTERAIHNRVRDFRMGLRRGLQPAEVAAERLPDFYRLLLQDRARHDAVPTHTEADLADLFRRVPQSLRLFLCEFEGQIAAGILVFVLNPRVAYTFYIAQDYAFKTLRPATTILFHVAQQMAREGFSHLDLGATTFDDLTFNAGLTAFKEGFGARGHCRDTWRWRVA